MQRKRKKGLISIAGLALAIALVISGFAAASSQAATWRVGGSSFAGEATFTGSGTFKFESPGRNATINCNEAVEGKISGSTTISEKLTITECVVKEAPQCHQAAPIVLDLEGSAEVLTSKSKTFSMQFQSGFGCTLPVNAEYTVPAFSAGYGPEAKALKENSAGTTKWGVYDFFLSDNSTRSLLGAQLGKTWTWQTTESVPAVSWHIGGGIFFGSASFTRVGTLTIVVPGRSLTVTCNESVTNGQISAATNLSQSLVLTGCVLTAPNCHVIEPLAVPMEGTGSEVLVPKFYLSLESGKGCALPLKNQINAFTLKTTYGSEAVKLSATGSGTTLFGTFTSTVSESSSIELSGLYAKETLGWN